MDEYPRLDSPPIQGLILDVHCGSLRGITPVAISWVTSCIHNDNNDKSSFPEVEHYYLLKTVQNNISVVGNIMSDCP